MDIEFEWDPNKSLSNWKKHGISFFQATEVWKSWYLEAAQAVKSKDGEIRNATFGLIANQVYVVIWTLRKSKIRIISARHAREDEKEIFYQNFRNHQRDG